MEIVVLGDSDSAGAVSGIAWPQVLEASLNETGQGPVSIRSVNFSAVPPSAAAYVERKLGELRPEMVILLVGSFAFTFGFVELRVQRLLGKRIAARAKRIEAWFDRRTRGRGAQPTRTNRLGRRVVRTVIGTEPLTTRAQLTRNYLEVCRALASFEHVEVILMAYPGVGAHAHTARARAQRKLFFDEMQRAAELHHFGWVDLRQHFDGSRDFSGFSIEELHFNLAGHQRIAAVMEPAVVARLGVRAG